MTPVWDSSRKTRRGFFLRAEDFFGYALRIDRMRAELKAQRAELMADQTISAVARAYALQPLERELGELQFMYQEGLDTHSHGEAFLELFRSRLAPGGVYLLDEPEAPLSPTRQLTFLSMLMTVVREQGAQVIMATHSPVLAAYPNAALLDVSAGGIEEVRYEQLPGVQFLSHFMRHREAILNDIGLPNPTITHN